jgi:hypothetical protein
MLFIVFYVCHLYVNYVKLFVVCKVYSSYVCNFFPNVLFGTLQPFNTKKKVSELFVIINACHC